jgi:hypothetical protein
LFKRIDASRAAGGVIAPFFANEITKKFHFIYLPIIVVGDTRPPFD